MNEPTNIFSELLSNPLGDLISSIGRGVGEAQAALDAGSLAQTLEIYREDNSSDRTEDDQRMIKLMRDIGYQPTFYVIPETEVEAQVSLSMTLNSEQQSPMTRNVASRHSIRATPINAGNQNRFGITANAMAKLKFKIVPVPPSAAVAELRVVPNLVGKTMNIQIIELIEQLGFTHKLEVPLISSKIETQTPAAQEIAKLGDEITLTFVEN